MNPRYVGRLLGRQVAPDGISMTDLLHILEGIAGQGRNWFQEQDWSKPRPSDDHADPKTSTYETETERVTRGKTASTCPSR